MSLLLTITMGLFSQGFLKPVDSNLFAKVKITQDAPVKSVWLFRPAATISAISLSYNKDTKQFDTGTLSSAGIGASYAHFIEVNGVPYSNYGFNVLALLSTTFNNEPAGLGIAGTISVLNLLSGGCGYNFTEKRFFLITGVVFNFN